MNYRHAFSMTAMTMSFFLLFTQVSRAQEATSFEQLQMLVKPGDKVYVTNSKGVVTVGKVTGLTTSVLSLKEKDTTRDWAESDVSRIMQHRHDSLKNGTLIGSGIGLGFGAIGAGACAADDTCDASTGALVADVLIFTGIGAALGAGIDALIHLKTTVYIGRTKVSMNLNTLKPILTNNRKGASVSLSF